MHFRLIGAIVIGFGLTFCLSFTVLNTDFDHNYTLSQADMGAINRLIVHRRDIRKPIFQVTMLRADYAEVMSGRSDKTGDPVTIFRVRKKGGSWLLEESTIRQTTVLTQTPNQALERTATRFAFTFYIPKTFSLRVARVPGGRRSALSR